MTKLFGSSHPNGGSFENLKVRCCLCESTTTSTHNRLAILNFSPSVHWCSHSQQGIMITMLCSVKRCYMALQTMEASDFASHLLQFSRSLQLIRGGLCGRCAPQTDRILLGHSRHEWSVPSWACRRACMISGLRTAL